MAPVADGQVKIAITIHITPSHALGTRFFARLPPKTSGQSQCAPYILINLVADEEIIIANADGQIEITIAIHVAPSDTGGGVIRLLGNPKGQRTKRRSIWAAVGVAKVNKASSSPGITTAERRFIRFCYFLSDQM